MTRKIYIGILIILLANTLAVFLFVIAAHAKPTTAIFDVNDILDLIDDNLTDGKCHTTAETCTLRAAVMQANALSGTNTINLPAGVYTLTIPCANEDYAVTGDLDIHSDLTINGTGADVTIVDGNQLNRVIDIFNPAKPIISGMTIWNGTATIGGV